MVDSFNGSKLLGGHHHGFFGRMFGEDVAGEVKREAGCKVLVVD